MVSQRAESEVQAVAGGKVAIGGLREGMGKIICLKVPLKRHR